MRWPPTPTASTVPKTTPAHSSGRIALARARKLGLDPRQRLAANDAWGFFAVLDDLLVTGPTRTNVNDFRALSIGLD